MKLYLISYYNKMILNLFSKKKLLTSFKLKLIVYNTSYVKNKKKMILFNLNKICQSFKVYI